MLKSITHILAVFTLLSLTHASAQLEVTPQSAAGTTTFDSNIVTNLITSGQESLAKVDAPISRDDPGFTAAGLNDDSVAASSNLTYYEVLGSGDGVLPATITFELNLDASTGGSTAGYTITNIQSIAGWTDSNLADQNLQVKISLDGGTSYTSLGSYVDNTSLGGGANSTDLSFTDDSGVIARNVTDVQFNFSDPTASDNDGAGGTLIRELEVFGSASTGSAPMSTPEPRSCLFALLILGSVVALRYRSVSSKFCL